MLQSKLDRSKTYGLVGQNSITVPVHKELQGPNTNHLYQLAPGLDLVVA